VLTCVVVFLVPCLFLRLAGGQAKETQLLVAPHYPPEDSDSDDDDGNMGLMGKLTGNRGGDGE